MTYTYFARPIGERGPVKIGLAGYPPTRLNDVGARLGCKVELIAAVRGDYEGRFHARFAEWHEGGEWFTWSDDMGWVIVQILLGTFDLESLPKARRLTGCGRHFQTQIGASAQPVQTRDC